MNISVLHALPRIMAVETLDGLAEDDPQAMRSRLDLRRVHRAMGTVSILRHALKNMTAPRRPVSPVQPVSPLRVLELGAGDGSLLVGVARALAPSWPPVELTLLDRQALIDRATIKRYAALGWTAIPKVVDVLEWAADGDDPPPGSRESARWDLIIANLFLHHFEGEQLLALLGAIAGRSNRFFACEPRRAWIALAGSHLIGVLGANEVTRNDAVLSVHAGFRGKELTALWPAHEIEWQVQEYSAGLFSHCFRAERREINEC